MFGPSVSHGFRVPPKSIRDIREHAMHVRGLFGLPVHQGFFNLGEFIESMVEWGITYDVVPSKMLPDGVEACCVPESGMILFSESTYDEACKDSPRARFTVIHELGHVALSHARTFHREATGQGLIKPYEDSEWQANQFAAEFLMPLEDIRIKGLSLPAQLVMEYQVSATAATKRLRQLEKQITRKRASSAPTLKALGKTQGSKIS